MEDIAAVFSERAFRTLADHGNLFVIPKRVDASNPVAPEVKLPARNQLELIRQRDDTERRQSRESFGHHSRNDSRTNNNEGPEPCPVSFRWNVSSFDPPDFLEAGEALPCGLANMGDELHLNPELLAYWNRVLRGLDLALEHPRTEANWLYSALAAQVPKSSLDDSNFHFPFTDLLLLDHFPVDRSIRHRQFYIAMMLPALYGGIHLAASIWRHRASSSHPL